MGKVTKTEIFLLVLTLLFAALSAALFFTGRPQSEGYTVTAQRGQTIEAGSPVGTAGTDHDLIFELRIGSKSVDPEPAMAGRSGLQYRESE